MFHFHAVLLVLRNSYKQPYQLLRKSPAMQQLATLPILSLPHLVLATTTTPHLPPALTLSPRYVDQCFCTVAYF